MNQLKKEFLDKIVEGIEGKKGVYSGVFNVSNGGGDFSYTSGIGKMSGEDRYFIASVTKLYITVLIMKLVEEEGLDLDNPISKYLEEKFIRGLNTYKGIEYSNMITLRHLISNTSGIPDYFFHKRENGENFADDLLAGQDISWDVDETIEYTKKLQAKFPPGKKGRAAYSDTNYQILGKIIEEIKGKSIGEVLQEEIFNVLGLKNTYAYNNTEDTCPAAFYYKSRELWVPNYIASVTAEGGIVSTAEESMIFLKAFFQGEFFSKNKIEELKKWNLILPPPSLFYYGIGLEKLYIPRIVSPLKPIKEIIGFWGQTGSFAWYNPDTELYFTGTTNQIDGSGHSAVTKAIIKIIKEAL